MRELPQLTRWVVAAAIFLAVSKFHGFFPILATIRAPLLLSTTALIMLLGTTGTWRPADLWKHWIPLLIIMMLMIAAVGIPFSIYPGQSFTVFNEAYSRTVLLGLLVWASARTPKGIRFMANTVLSACLGAAFLAFYMGRHDNEGRLSGGYAYDPNDIGLIAVIAIPFCLWWIIENRKQSRYLMLFAIPFLLNLLVKTKSRGAFLGLLAISAGFLALGLGRKAHPTVRRVGVTIGLLMVLSIPLYPSSYLDKMRTITDENDYNRTSPRGRKAVWKRGWGYAFANPILGVGIGNFGSAEGRSDIGQARAMRRTGWKWGTAHNSYIQVAAEMGLIAFAAFVLITVGSVIALFRTHLRHPEDRLAPLLAVSLLGFCVTGYFLSWAYYDLTYALIALSCAVMTQHRPQRKA